MPISLSLDPVRALTGPETDSNKQLLTDWARSSRHMDAQMLKDNLVIERADEVPLYEFTLLSLIETRNPNLQEIVRAPDGADQPAASPVDRAQLKLWDAPSEKRSDYASAKGTYVIQSSLRLETCAACGAVGSVGCDRCEGRGQASCGNCQGRGKTLCENCKGLAKLSCQKCGGKGLAKGVTLMVTQADACDACKGAGKTACPHCEYGSTACAQCGGAGSHGCGKCVGTGKLICPTCAGKSRFLKGLSFEAEFKPVLVTDLCVVEPVPRAFVEKVLAHKKAGGQSEAEGALLGGDALAQSALAEPVKAALNRLAGKAGASENARVVRQKISWSKAAAIRLAGAFCGQPFIYWIEPESRQIFTESDPMKNLAETEALAAEKAWTAGDSAKALEFAGRALDLDPLSPAKRILEEWKKSIVRDTFIAALAGAALVAAGMDVFILVGIKGLHKMGLVLKLLGALPLAGVVIGGCLLPVARKMSRRSMRYGAVAGATAGAILAGLLVAHAGFGWHPVRSADQAALDGELGVRFPHGVSDVYWPDDLAFLESIAQRYGGTGVEMKTISEGIEKQRRLKGEKEKAQGEFARKLAEIVQSPDLRPADKRAQIASLRELYSLQSVDVSGTADALKAVDEEAKHAAQPEVRRGRISIVPSDVEEEKKPAPQRPGKAAKPAKVPQIQKLDQKATAKKMKSDISAILKDRKSSPADKRKKLLALEKSYQKLHVDVAPIKKEIQKIDEKLDPKSKSKSIWR